MNKSPFVLIILDGFGHEPASPHNAITLAQTPTWDDLWHNHPHYLLNCSGKSVGLPDNQMGNSEVGHMNISAGRIIYQDLTRIDLAIESKEFYHNPVLLDLIRNSKQHRSLHICGLVSDGGIHSHIQHFISLIELAKQHELKNVYVHAFLDGRDTPPKSALEFLITIDDLLKSHNLGKIASIVGRYYAMDRDKNWDRTLQAYNLLTHNFNDSETNKEYFIYPDLTTAVTAAYSRGETDEFIKPTIIADSIEQYKSYQVKDDDNLIFMNFRADRARQLSQLFINHNHTSHQVKLNKIKLNKFVTLTQYQKNFIDDNCVAYKPQSYNNMLGEFLSHKGLTQLRIAETEKYAHVTFFFNGGREQPFENEDRVLIPSPKVSTFNLKPEMSAYELTRELTTAIESQKYDVIICNYANPDMVGHTGDLNATIKAIEAIDECLTMIVSSVNKSHGQLFITADHGNAECMFDEGTKQAHTAHTHSKVPLVYYNAMNYEVIATKEVGSLVDIAPSLLYLMGIEPPAEMTGTILFRLLG